MKLILPLLERNNQLSELKRHLQTTIAGQSAITVNTSAQSLSDAIITANRLSTSQGPPFLSPGYRGPAYQVYQKLTESYPFWTPAYK